MRHFLRLTLALVSAWSAVPAAAAPGEVYLTFLASPASVIGPSPGHAFLCFELHLNAGIKEDCFGFYPLDWRKALDGEGVVTSELSHASTPDRFSAVTVSTKHKIDDSRRRAIYNEVQKWAGSDYKLVVRNCGDLVLAAAKAAGLTTPRRNDVVRPVDFVEAIKRLNGLPAPTDLRYERGP